MKKIFLFALLGVIILGAPVYAEETEAPSHRIEGEMERTLDTTTIFNPEEDASGVRPNVVNPGQPAAITPGRIAPAPGRLAPGRVNLTQISTLIPSEDRIFGDLNGDGHVDFTDFKILVESFGPCSLLKSSCPADLNDDKTVNTLDALLLLNNFTRYGDDMPGIASSLERCQSIRTAELQRRCLSVSMQEAEVSLRAKNVAPILAERMAMRAENAESAPEQVGVRVEMRVRAYLGYMSNMLIRMTAAIERLEGLADRIDSRIQKIEAESGADLSNAKSVLTEARRQIEIAKASHATVSQNYEEILEGENLTEEFARIRELVQKLRDEIKNVHQSLVGVINIIGSSIN